MKVSELIEQLGDLQLEHGDLEVVNEADQPIGVPEFNEDLGEQVIVIG